MLKESVHPVFWQYHVICCAFYSVCLEICRGSGGKFILFLALAKRGKGNALFVFSLGKHWAKNKMCIFLCGGRSHLFLQLHSENVKPDCNNWTPQSINIKLQRKNIIQQCENIKPQHKNIISHCANIKLQCKKIKLHHENVTLHRKNIKFSRSNIIFGLWIQYSKRLYILVKLLHINFSHIFWRFGR